MRDRLDPSSAWPRGWESRRFGAGLALGSVALLIALAVGPSPARAAQQSTPPPASQGTTPAAGADAERLALTHHPKGEARARHSSVEQPQAVLLKREPFTYLHNIFRDALFQYRPPIGKALDLQPELIFTGQQASRTAAGAAGQVAFKYRLEAAWTAWGEEGGGRGVLNFKLEGVRNLGAPRPRNLSDNLGSALSVSGMWEPYAVALRTLWWQFESGDRRVRLDLGKIRLSEFFDENEVAGDEDSQFLSDALVNNPAIPFAGDGLGAHFQLRGRRYTLRAGVGDADAVASGSPFRTVRDGRVVGLLQLNLKAAPPVGGKKRPGTYRFILWGTNQKGAGGAGFAVNFDQSLTETVEVFVRVGAAQCRAVSERLLPFRWFVSSGLGFTPRRRRDDQLGLAFGRGGSPLEEVGTQTIVEAYWRIQVSHTMQLSPLLQLVKQPATGSQPVAVPGLRLRVTF